MEAEADPEADPEALEVGLFRLKQKQATFFFQAPFIASD